MIRAVRLKEIRHRLDREGAVSVSDLAAQYAKTTITIRRDLEFLEAEGFLTRSHGGAVVRPRSDYELSPYGTRQGEHSVQKALVAKRAAKLVSDGDTLIINAGTTMREMARHLTLRKGLRIATNGITLIQELAAAPGAQILLLGGDVDFRKMGTVGPLAEGGDVDFRKMGTVGPLAEAALSDIHALKAFLGITAISLDHGLSMHSPTEARINAAFIEAADEVTVVVDSSKFETPALYRVTPLEAIHRIVTDSGLPPAIAEQLRAMGLDLILVDR